ncbi:MAG: hypothetical protein ACRC41_15430 [Sarcina sp.]
MKIVYLEILKQRLSNKQQRKREFMLRRRDLDAKTQMSHNIIVGTIVAIFIAINLKFWHLGGYKFVLLIVGVFLIATFVLLRIQGVIEAIKKKKLK